MFKLVFEYLSVQGEARPAQGRERDFASVLIILSEKNSW